MVADDEAAGERPTSPFDVPDGLVAAVAPLETFEPACAAFDEPVEPIDEAAWDGLTSPFDVPDEFVADIVPPGTFDAACPAFDAAPQLEVEADPRFWLGNERRRRMRVEWERVLRDTLNSNSKDLLPSVVSSKRNGYRRRNMRSA